MCPIISGDDSNQFEKWEPGEVFANTFSSANLKQPSSPQADNVAKSTFTQEDVERLIQQAKLEAYEQGRQDAMQQAQTELAAQAQGEMQGQLDNLGRLMKSLNEPLTAIDDSIEKDILNLVMQISSILYRREVSMNPEQLLTVVREAKNLLPSSQSNVKIHLNPDDAKMLQDSSFELKDDSLCDLFIEDDNLQRGDCRVISDQTQVDATLEARLNSIIEQVMASE